MSDPAVLLLDEPVAGVNPTLTLRILKMIEQLKQQGRTIFLIEHDMEVVMNRCDWILVLHQGRKLAEGPPATVKADARVVEAYLGQ
jgi:branched-chain amino acid transport system ATP-binding protein